MKNVLGIDVGGTKIASAIVDEKLRLTEFRLTKTSQTDLVSQLIEIILSYSKFEAIGLALPGPVQKDGLVKRLPNVARFNPLNLKETFATKFNVPVEVLNDAKAFAYAEAIVGDAKDLSSIAGLVLGTGTGVGFVVDKEIFFGKDGLAGEFDHVILPDGKLFRMIVKENRPFKDADHARNYLRTLISFIVLSFNPDIIMLSGGWSGIEGLEDLANELAINVGGFENQTAVKVSKLEYPSLLGAALLALKKME